MKRSAVLLASLSAVTVFASDGGIAAPRSMVEVLCGWFGLSCDGSLDAVRDDTPVWGNDVRVFDFKTKKEASVAKCKQCRTPLYLRDGRLVFVTPEGLVVGTPDGGAQTLPVKRARQLVGQSPHDDGKLLVIGENDADGGGFVALEVDLRDGGTRTLALDAPPELIRPSQISDAGVVYGVSHGTLGLAKGMTDGGSLDLKGAHLLHTSLPKSGFRFDPAWAGDGRVIYVAKDPGVK